MIFKRKEVKDYGCKKMVEGTYSEGDSCLVIEDVVVYGTSIIETSEVKQTNKLKSFRKLRFFRIYFILFYSQVAAPVQVECKSYDRVVGS